MFHNAELINEMDGLRRFAYKLTQNQADAEDLLQSTILRALEKKHLYKDNNNLFGWTSKVMFNIFISNYRRKTKFESQYDPEPAINAQSVEASQETKMEMLNVQDAMDRLSEDHRDILIMVCVKGMSYEDVSQALDIPVGTVRSRLSRARDSLDKELNTVKTPCTPFAPDAGYAASTAYAA